MTARKAESIETRAASLRSELQNPENQIQNIREGKEV